MTPIGYTLHGHPLCLRCVDGDDDHALDGTIDTHDGRRVEADVAPIHAGDPADAEPWPTYEADEFVDIDPALFAFACDGCNAHGITPHKGGGTNALGHRHAA